MNKYEKKRAVRQGQLEQAIPGAVSCDYIASVDRRLPNGFTVKSITVGDGEYSWKMWAVNGEESRLYQTNDFVMIQGVRVYYITI
jgi:hypothetical protein